MADVNKMRALAAIETLLEGFYDLKEQVRAITDKETTQDCPRTAMGYPDWYLDQTNTLRGRISGLEERIRSLNKELEKVRMERDAAQRTLIAIKNMSINTNISLS